MSARAHCDTTMKSVRWAPQSNHQFELLVFSHNGSKLIRYSKFYFIVTWFSVETNSLYHAGTPDFTVSPHLEQQKQTLIQEQEQLSLLITTINRTIQYTKGEIMMKDHEKFQAFKQDIGWWKKPSHIWG